MMKVIICCRRADSVITTTSVCEANGTRKCLIEYKNVRSH